MNTVDVEHLRQIKTLPSLVKFLRDELDWPVEADEIDELTFDYTSEELGLDAKYAKMVKEIKQIRPLDSKQPWGIFWINFEKKRLPMVVLRRILGSLVIKRRASARKTDRPSWQLNDLLFISSYGEEEHRTISFAHFAEDPNTDQLPVLRVLGWDDRKSIMNLDRVGNRLHSHLRWPADSKAADAWRKRWSDAFTDRYHEAIRSADELIPRLAELAAGVRVRVRDVLHAEIERGPMRRLFAAVQKFLIHNMNEDGFADMYAQTVAYGLLSARFSRSEGLTAQNLVQLTAVSNPFLENLLENLFRLNRGKFHFDVDEVGINDVLDLLRNTNIEAIKAAFSDKNPAEDPVIRFYEGFLKQYDPQQRIQRGVFFTPRPVVSYIVRSVDELLRTEFGLEDGLASTATWADMKHRFPELTIPKGAKPDDPFVCILDPAVGTGTFLFECIEIIERTMKDKWCSESGRESWGDPEIIRRWREYVPNHLLPRLYGYELMMAPYAIAHLKLALKLGETGYQFQENNRLHIYLTNSLDPPSELADLQLADLFTALATEAQEVNEIKANKRFIIVIGNPPYAGHSANDNDWVRNLLRTKLIDGANSYFEVDGLDLNERNPKWLNDDYVKFIRFAQYRLAESGTGILGFITNHAYIDNPTFRGMRQSLMKSFEKIYVADLHGNTKKKEKCPDGSKDENVFDIQQGVAIGIFKKKEGDGKVQHTPLWGLRQKKYKELMGNDINSTDCKELGPRSPFYLFIPQDIDVRSEYEKGWPFTEVMPVNSVGIVTSRDNLVFAYSRAEIDERVSEFLNHKISDDYIREMYFSGPRRGQKPKIYQQVGDSSCWKLSTIRKTLQKSKKKQNIVICLYRPFDQCYLWYEPEMIERGRWQVMRHMLAGENIALLTKRQGKTSPYSYFFITDQICESCVFESAYANNSVMPIYLYPVDGELNFTKGDWPAGKNGRTPNLDKKFVDEFAEVIGLAFITDGKGNLEKTFGPEDIFNYIYAVFHSQTYRSRYAEFLKRDFPRVPITSDIDMFRTLCKLGGELVALHLMKSDKLNDYITTFPVSGDNTVSKVGEKSKTLAGVSTGKGKLFINNTQYFDGLPQEVWDFHIGGYKVCYKWLYDRKKTGRKLSAEDIEHYHKIVVAINETIKIMKQIDETIEAHGGWPIK